MLDRSVFDSLLTQVTSGAKNVNAQVDERLGSNAGLAKGAAIGGLGALLLGGSLKPKKLLKMAGMAGVGALAYHVIQNSGGGSTSGNPAPQSPAPQAPSPTPAPMSSVPSTPQDVMASGPAPQLQNLSAEDEDRHTKMMIAAMIAAANADGHISTEERGRISAALDDLDISREGRMFVLDEMSAPKGIRDIAGMVKSDVEASEVYLISALVVGEGTPECQTYLSNLAMVLDIDPSTVMALNAVETA